MPATPQRATRADAVRNREKILAAAQEMITAHGPEAGMGQIARTAGVAVGTLYRHFPTKADLLTAVLFGYVADIAADAVDALERARAGSPAHEEVVGFLERVTESTAKNHAVKMAAQGLGVQGHGDDQAEGEAARALAQLLTLAQQAGHMNPTVTVADIYLLISTAPVDQPARVRNRWLDLVVAGLTGLRVAARPESDPGEDFSLGTTVTGVD
ncbi:TetR/AcrR family transcriptional regulator [Nocardiopsis eucommiae]|uniref:TetR/AcrR family transcriptional regulator n=1 Tax=Nocardiopsis eucommiae TaxID=2831970 RepID=A0A975QJB8_9ACTN|nr:TetR/AcrR family transcriptional regulator [Nocardiopsis eucommiae]